MIAAGLFSVVSLFCCILGAMYLAACCAKNTMFASWLLYM